MKDSMLIILLMGSSNKFWKYSQFFFRKICFLFWSGQVFFKLKKQVANQGSRRYIYNYFAFVLKIGFHHIKIINKFCKKKIWLLKVSKSRKQFTVSWILPKTERNSLSWVKKMLWIVSFVRFLGESRRL